MATLLYLYHEKHPICPDPIPIQRDYFERKVDLFLYTRDACRLFTLEAVSHKFKVAECTHDEANRRCVSYRSTI